MKTVSECIIFLKGLEQDIKEKIFIHKITMERILYTFTYKSSKHEYSDLVKDTEEVRNISYLAMFDSKCLVYLASLILYLEGNNHPCNEFTFEDYLLHFNDTRKDILDHPEMIKFRKFVEPELKTLEEVKLTDILGINGLVEIFSKV